MRAPDARPASRTSAPPGAPRASTRASLETGLAPPSPGALGSGGRAGCGWDEPGAPPPPLHHRRRRRTRGFRGWGVQREAAQERPRGERDAGHAVAAPGRLQGRVPAGARGSRGEWGVSGGLSVRGPRPWVTWADYEWTAPRAPMLRRRRFCGGPPFTLGGALGLAGSPLCGSPCALRFFFLSTPPFAQPPPPQAGKSA